MIEVLVTQQNCSVCVVLFLEAGGSVIDLGLYSAIQSVLRV